MHVSILLQEQTKFDTQFLGPIPLDPLKLAYGPGRTPVSGGSQREGQDCGPWAHGPVGPWAHGSTPRRPIVDLLESSVDRLQSSREC